MAEKPGKKAFRLGLVPAILLTAGMVSLALLWGAHQGWQQELGQVKRSLGQVEERLSLRKQAGANLLVVAKRHLPAEEALLSKLQGEVEALGSKASLVARTSAAANMQQTATQLFEALQQVPGLQQDSRDSMYVNQLLPQQLEQSAPSGWHDEYSLQAHSYNQRLQGSFSGWLARLTGVRQAERLTEGVE